jgi:hypothetical protein
MRTDSWILAAATIAIALVLWLVGTFYWRRRIERWCREQKLQLVHWHRARIYEGPRAWWRSEHQNTFFIEALDTDDILREGYLVFGSFWAFSPRRVEIHWR